MRLDKRPDPELKKARREERRAFFVKAVDFNRGRHCERSEAIQAVTMHEPFH